MFNYSVAMNSQSAPCGDFSCTHRFCSGSLLTTVCIGKYRLIDCKKRIVVFEKGTCLRGGVIQRLAIYKRSGMKLLNATAHPSVHRNVRACFQVFLNENDLYGLIKGVQSRRVRYSKYMFSPTITIVAKEATVILTAIENDYERSMRQHDEWYDCLKKKLHFGGYWSVEHETAAGSSTVTLCVSESRLTLLAVSPDDDTVFTIVAEYSTSNIVCWKLHFTDRQGCHVAYLSVTVAPDADPANFERLRFRVDHNETVASDISEVLSRFNLPRMQCEVRRQLTPQYLDLQLHHRSEQLSPTLKSHGPYHTSSGGKRRSRDDLDMFLNRRPDCPPPRLPPKTQPHQHMLNSYDLNALSCTDSVKDAVHFYQNIGNIVRQRPRRPPDVVASHLDEDEEYWSIVFTLFEVLRKKKPEPDTLGLTTCQRLSLCFLLLDDTIQSWKNLAEHIGLKQEAVTMIETLFRRTSCCDGVTPTECVLRHWQFVHNRSLVAGKTSSATNSQPAAPPCTLPSLINILDQIGRHDLAIRLSTFTPAVAEESSQA